MRNSRIVLFASLLTMAFVAYAPVNSAMISVASGDASLPAIHTMGIYDPIDPIGTLVGNSGAAATNLVYHNGPIEHVPAVYVCYWAWPSDPYGEKPYLQNFLSGMGGSTWSNVLTQYYGPSGTYITNPTGQLKGTWTDSTSLPSHPTQSQLASAAVRCEGHFGFNKDADYFVATPSGHSQSGFGTQWCAYHSTASTSSGTIAWTYLPYMHDAGTSCGQNFVNSGSAGTLDGVSIVGGHEYAEAATDPQLNAWYDSSGAENGDKCAWISPGSPGGSHDLSLSTGTFAVQTTWSNKVSGCAG